MIDREHQLSVTRQAKLLDLSRAAVYYQATPVSERDLAPFRLIGEIHLDQPLGRKHVAALMRRMGIEALCPKPGTSRESRGRGHTVYPYLLRIMNITETNQVWAMDTTYIPMRHGFVYLIGVIDVATRRVLAHELCTTLEAYHAVEIVEQAIARFGTPEIVNTDQGSQFSAFEFTEAIKNRGTKLSMDDTGAWRDNVFVARFYERAYDTVSEARADIAEYIAWYNDKRPHTSLDD